MLKMTKIALSGIVCLGLIGCGDSYSDKNSDNIPVEVVDASSQLKASNRNAKFLVDVQGKSLYTFDNDTLNKSNCSVGPCQDTWPLFVGIDNNDIDLKVVPGSEGHLAYRQHPLYYYTNDQVVGDVNGNNVNNVWHLVHAQTAPADQQVKLSDTNIKQTFLTDKDQRALYTFDKDIKDVSNCYDSTPTSGTGCESVWPVFYSADLGELPAGTVAADFGVIDRNASKAKVGEPLQQVTYKGKPLYYFTPDNKEALSTKGDWVQGVWHLIELAATKVVVPLDTTAGEVVVPLDTTAGKTLYSGDCVTCHREDGLGTPGGAIQIGTVGDAKKIEELLNYMKTNGAGKNSTMVSIAKGLSDQQIKDVSAYIATLKK